MLKKFLSIGAIAFCGICGCDTKALPLPESFACGDCKDLLLVCTEEQPSSKLLAGCGCKGKCKDKQQDQGKPNFV